MLSKSAIKMRRWRKKNPERQLEIDRRWRRNNLKKARAKNRVWYRENREKELARSTDYARKNKRKIAVRARLKHHRMTQQEHDAKLREQNNRCAICRKKFRKTPHIDHRHNCCLKRITCGKCNRGLLCDDCNLGLGRFKDSIVVLSNAIQYLKEYQK